MSYCIMRLMESPAAEDTPRPSAGTTADNGTESGLLNGAVKKPSGRRIVILFVVLLALVAIAYLSPLRQYLARAEEVRDAIRGTGPLAPLVCVLGVAVLVSVGIPRLLLCSIGGLAFGFVQGLLWTLIGTLIGYYAVFLFVRWGGRGLVLHRRPKLARFADLIRDQGILGVIVVRQVPIHGTVTNLVLGLSRVRHRHFLIGTAVGLIPEAVPFVLIGTGIMQPSFEKTAGYLAIAAAALALVWLALGLWLRSFRRSRAGREG